MADEKKKRYVLEATDAFSKVFDDFRKGLNGIANDTSTVRGGLSSLGGAIDSLGVSWKSLFGVMAVGGGLAGFGAMIKSTTDTEAALLRLSQTTGMSVESLSSLAPAAKASGMSMDDVAAASVKLSKAMIESQDPHSKASAAFKTLGLSAKDAAGNLKTPDDMMLELAKKLDTFKDGASKTAIALDTMGKSGANAIPFLHELADQGELQVKVTQQQAQEAKKFEDGLRTLQAQSTQLARNMVNTLLPAVNDVTAAFLKARNDEGLWEGAIAATSTLFEKIFGTSHELHTKELADVNARIKKYEEEKDTLDVFLQDQKGYEAALKRRSELEVVVSEEEIEAQDRRAEAGQRATAAAKKDLDYRAQAGAAGEKVFETERAQLNQKIALLNYATDEEQYLWKLKTARFADLTPKERQELIDLEAKAAGIQRLRDETDALNRVEQQNEDYETARTQRARQVVDGLKDQNESLQHEIDTLGLSTAARDQANNEFERTKALRGVTNQQAIDAINHEYDERGALLATRDAIEAELSAYGELANGVANFFVQVIGHGKSAVQALRDQWHTFRDELISFFAKKWTLQILGSMVGGSTGAALAAQGATAGGSNSLAGAAVSAAGSYIGGAGTAIGGTYGASEGFAMGFSSGVAAPGAGLAETAGAAMSGAYDSVVAVLADIPVYGWIALAVIAIAAYLGGKGGGPKTGGSSMQSFDTSGNVSDANVSVPGTDNGRFFTPNNMDAAATSAVKDVAAGYFAMLNRYGGTSPGAVAFGLGFDNDPRGTAQSRVSSAASVNGQEIYSNRDVSMDDKDVPAATALEGQRMVLAALQHSSLPPAIAAILKSVDAISATADQISKVYALADAFQGLTTMLGDFDLGAVVTGLHKNSADNFSDSGSSLVNFASSTKITTDSLGQLTQATMAYRQSAVELISGLENAKSQMDEMFSGTSRSIKMSGMSDQDKYNFLQGESGKLLDQLKGSNSAEEITALGGKINQDIQDAYNLLSPADQASHQQEFLDRIQSVQEQTHNKLQALEEKAASDVKTTLDRVSAIMEKAAKDFGDAADKQKAAAETPPPAVRIDFTANVPGDVTVNEGGG